MASLRNIMNVDEDHFDSHPIRKDQEPGRSSQVHHTQPTSSTYTNPANLTITGQNTRRSPSSHHRNSSYATEVFAYYFTTWPSRLQHIQHGSTPEQHQHRLHGFPIWPEPWSWPLSHQLLYWCSHEALHAFWGRGDLCQADSHHR